MTAQSWPAQFFSLADWEKLPEDSSRRYELVEGVMHVTPRPTLAHQHVLGSLVWQLRQQLPSELTVLPEVEVLVESGPLGESGSLPTVRVLDIVVVDTVAVVPGLARLDSRDIHLAVEILSPGTRRTDRVTKLSEYAEAGIPAYWLIDPETSTVSAMTLVDGAYQPSPTFQVAEHRVQVDVPPLFA